MLSVHFSLCVVATGDLSCSLPWPGLCLSCVLPCGIVHSSMLESPPCRWFCTGQEAVLGQGLRLIPRHCVLHADAAVLGAGLLESHWQHYLLCAQWLVISNSFVTPWTVTYQVLLSVGFPTQEYWSGLPFPPPGDLPDPGIKLQSPVSCIPGGLSAEPSGKPQRYYPLDSLPGTLPVDFQKNDQHDFVVSCRVSTCPTRLHVPQWLGQYCVHPSGPQGT